MAPIIALALKLAPLFPPLVKHLAGDKAEDIAETVVGVAQEITGFTDPEEAVAKLEANSPEAIEFKTKMAELEFAREEAYLKDRQSARSRDAVISQGGKNRRADMMFLLAILVVVGIMVALWTTVNLDEYVKGAITLILGRFLGYLDGIYSFEFGTTRDSKTKDKTIATLSGRSYE